MIVGYVDSSCLAAIAFAEPGHEALIARLEGFDQLVSSNLLEAELRAAFRREDATSDGALLGRLSWVLPDRPLSVAIGTVLARDPFVELTCGTWPAPSTSRPTRGSCPS